VYEVVRLINVWSSWGKKRERGKKKQIQKPSSSPTACPKEEEKEECRSKHHCFGLLCFFGIFSFFCMGTQKWVIIILMQKFQTIVSN